MGNIQLATLGGGCYWCLEAYYKLIQGVVSVESGYSGGKLVNPTSNQVYSGKTGHAEVVQLRFDSTVIKYEDILEIFFVMHDPTTLNRQGNDIGEIYRSVIFYHTDSQKSIAESMVNNFAKKLWDKPIVTTIIKYETFWPADEQMQNYYEKNPQVAYCQFIIEPKIQKLRTKYSARLKQK